MDNVWRISSFALPLLLWCAISYVPWLWHPMMKVTDPGSVEWMQIGSLVERKAFAEEQTIATQNSGTPPKGIRANPLYLPAPHQVAVAMVKAFATPPLRRGDSWLHESLWHSIRVIVWGFLLSSLFGVPLGILCGANPTMRLLFEPFIEFFRYLPAPAFGALAVAVLGISDAPKIAIIFIGTFFQQVLVIANTTRRFDPSLVEAAQTLGAKPWRILLKVVVPGILPNLYRDQRILLGWAWTYLIVAEVIGESTGITWFINQQAKYRMFDNVYAAILIIGVVGLLSDLILASLERNLFPWTGRPRHRLVQMGILAWQNLPKRTPINALD